MLKTSIFFYTILNVLFVGAVSAAQFKYDLALERINFSEERLITGSTVRIYARVGNVGTADVKAHVSFYHGPLLAGESQVVSARSGGFADEVFIDFVIPDQPFNIRAVIQGADPRDENSVNDEIMTSLITPLRDSDRDGIVDESDLCPQVSNPDQKDNDGDRLGDLCDDDDDNDGVPDAREVALGTNPLLADTDGDGVSDLNDAFPLDRTRTVVPPPPPPPSPLISNLQSPILGGGLRGGVASTGSLPTSSSPPIEGVENNIPSPLVGEGEGEGSVSPILLPKVQPRLVAPPSSTTIPQAVPRRQPRRRELTRDERIAWRDSSFVDAGNPKVWGAISLLSLLALASFIVEKVKARRAGDLPGELETPLVPVGSLKPPVAAGSKPKKRTRKSTPNKRAPAKSRNLRQPPVTSSNLK